MSIKLVVTADNGESVEIAMSEDVVRCIENTIGYRQDERKSLNSPDSEVTYWLQQGRIAMRRALIHQQDTRDAMENAARQARGDCPTISKPRKPREVYHGEEPRY